MPPVFTTSNPGRANRAGMSAAQTAQVVAEQIANGGYVIGPATSVLDRLATYADTSGKLIKDSGKTLADVQADALAAAIAAILPVNLATSVSGDLPFANIAQIATARILGRNTAGTGDIEVLTTLPAAVQDLITRLGTIVSGDFGNTALKQRDVGGSFTLTQKLNETLTASRTLNLLLSDGDRNLNLGAPVAFTATMTAQGGGFSLGNGTIDATYRELGGFVLVKVVFTVGSSTNPGTNFWRVNVSGLPWALANTLDTGVCVAANTSGGFIPGVVLILNTSPGEFAFGSLASTALATSGAWQGVYPYNPPATGYTYSASLVLMKHA